MGKSKTELFTPFQNEIAEMAKALAHPARVAILEYLIKKDGQCVCGDIVDELPLAQATVSQHLKAMKDAGIIKGLVDGSFKCYCVDNANCIKFWQLLNSMFSKVKNCC